MLPVILDISEITGRKTHFVTYLIAGLFLSCPRCFDCCPIRAKVYFMSGLFAIFIHPVTFYCSPLFLDVSTYFLSLTPIFLIMYSGKFYFLY